MATSAELNFTTRTNLDILILNLPKNCSESNADVIFIKHADDTLRATCMYGAQFQNREFFSDNNNASNEQFSLALQHWLYNTFLLLRLPHSLIKKIERGSFVPFPGS